MAKQTSTSPKIVSQKSTREHKLNVKPVDEVEYEVIQYDNPKIVEETERLYPEMTMEFKRIMFDSYELFCKKNMDYSPSNIALGSSLSTDEEVKVSLSGIWFRMMDKIQRLKQLVVLGNKNQVDESINDTYQDLSNYAIISQIVKNGKWGK
jgi:hypothetical protein